jgi:hypothetical protein
MITSNGNPSIAAPTLLAALTQLGRISQDMPLRTRAIVSPKWTIAPKKMNRVAFILDMISKCVDCQECRVTNRSVTECKVGYKDMP